MPANPAPSEDLAAEPLAPTPGALAIEHDELAALDAGWD
jgi:hypothetical protein